MLILSPSSSTSSLQFEVSYPLHLVTSLVGPSVQTDLEELQPFQAVSTAKTTESLPHASFRRIATNSRFATDFEHQMRQEAEELCPSP